METINDRIERLLDKLDDPTLNKDQVDSIKSKIEFLRGLES